MAVGDVLARDAGQPDDLLQPQQTAQLRLALGLADARIAVRIEHAAARDDRRALAVHFDAAAFQHELGVDQPRAGAFGHERCDFGVLVVFLLVAPAVEIEADATELARRALHEHGPGVAHPQVVDRMLDELDRRAAQARRDRVILFPHQHLERLVRGDRLRDRGEILAHHGQQPRAPDILARAERHPGRRVRRAFVRHVPDGALLRVCGTAEQPAHRAGGQRRTRYGQAAFQQLTSCGHGIPLSLAGYFNDFVVCRHGRAVLKPSQVRPSRRIAAGDSAIGVNSVRRVASPG